MSETAPSAQTVRPIDVIMWAKEVELRGLPLDVQQKFERRGAFWATRGLRMPCLLFQQLETEHPELTFTKRELKDPEEPE